jgi:hypothetical protein
MDDELAILLAKALTKQTKGQTLAAGDYEIDETITLHVHGTARKLPDVPYTPTVAIPLLATMALLLEKSGFQREVSKALLIDAMTEALNTDVIASPIVAERVRDIETAMEHVRQVTGDLPKEIRSGATNVDLTIDLLEPAAV